MVTMNAEQCKAICDKLENAINDIDIFISDELAEIDEVVTAFKAVKCLAYAMDKAYANLYELLSDDEKRTFDLL